MSDIYGSFMSPAATGQPDPNLIARLMSLRAIGQGQQPGVTGLPSSATGLPSPQPPPALTMGMPPYGGGLGLPGMAFPTGTGMPPVAPLDHLLPPQGSQDSAGNTSGGGASLAPPESAGTLSAPVEAVPGGGYDMRGIVNAAVPPAIDPSQLAQYPNPGDYFKGIGSYPAPNLQGDARARALGMIGGLLLGSGLKAPGAAAEAGAVGAQGVQSGRSAVEQAAIDQYNRRLGLAGNMYQLARQNVADQNTNLLKAGEIAASQSRAQGQVGAAVIAADSKDRIDQATNALKVNEQQSGFLKSLPETIASVANQPLAIQAAVARDVNTQGAKMGLPNLLPEPGAVGPDGKTPNPAFSRDPKDIEAMSMAALNSVKANLAPGELAEKQIKDTQDYIMKNYSISSENARAVAENIIKAYGINTAATTAAAGQANQAAIAGGVQSGENARMDATLGVKSRGQVMTQVDALAKLRDGLQGEWNRYNTIATTGWDPKYGKQVVTIQQPSFWNGHKGTDMTPYKTQADQIAAKMRDYQGQIDTLKQGIGLVPAGTTSGAPAGSGGTALPALGDMKPTAFVQSALDHPGQWSLAPGATAPTGPLPHYSNFQPRTTDGKFNGPPATPTPNAAVRLKPASGKPAGGWGPGSTLQSSSGHSFTILPQ